MKLLFLDKKGEGYVGAPQTRHEFEQTVAKYAECMFAGEGWNNYVPNESMGETVERVMPDCDWVIDSDNNLHNKKPKNRDYKVGLFISDLHGKHHYDVRNALKFAEMINEANYDAIFMRYTQVGGFNYPSTAFFDTLKCDKYWVPWSVDPHKYNPQRPYRYDVSFIGSIGNAYPLRNDIAANLKDFKNKYSVLIQESPRGSTYQRNIETLRKTHLVGEDYVKTLGLTRVLIFGCSKYKYPLQKFFEGTCSGCLVMSDKPYGAEELGFIDGETYVEITKENWRKKLAYYLEDKDEANRVAANGLNNTLINHNHDRRAKQWLNALEN